MLRAFEKAELLYKTEDVSKYMTFVVVGGGPTGVEIAGAIAEIANKTMRDFRRIDTRKTRIMLVEGGPAILAAYPLELSNKATEALRELGVEVITSTQVTSISKDLVQIGDAVVSAKNIIWAAGNVAAPLTQLLQVEKDRVGRVLVNADCSIPGMDNVFVIGDAAHFVQQDKPLPGVAQVAIQQGRYVAGVIKKQLPGGNRKPFRYKDYGSMATIGRARAIALVGGVAFSGFFAWLAWSFIHVFKMISFRNRYKVMAEWIWYYLSFRNGIRLITGKE
jgi:NADH dehydrogenase